MSQPIPTSPEEAARISAQIAEYEAISTRLRAETEGMSQQHPHQWTGMNSDQVLTLADTLPELIENSGLEATNDARWRYFTWTPTRQS